MFVDYVIELGLDAVEDKLIDLKSQKEIRDKLAAFLERQSHINEACTIEEEIDFEGLSAYIHGELLEDVKMRLFGEKSERQSSRSTILSKAASYAQANTRLSKERAMKLTATAIDILRSFYRQKVNQDMLLIATEIEDTISDDMRGQLSHQAQQIETIIEKSVSQGFAIVCSKIDSMNFLSIDRSLQLLNDGHTGDVESGISAYLSSISSAHVLFPHYGYEVTSVSGNNQLQSVPLSSEAIEKYPPQIRCVGTINLGGQPIREFSTGTIEYANMHQLPITLDIHEARKFLGDTPDPVQHEAERFVGERITIPPKPFPEAFPCSISLDGSVELDYILLRTQEILEDGTIVISNQEQENCPFRIRMILYVSECKIDYKIKLENPSNSDLLRYAMFMKKASQGAKIAIKALPLGKNIIEARTGPFEYHSGFSSSDDEISFLEKVILIEKFFSTSVELPKEIMSDDFNMVNYLVTLIGGGECGSSWERFEFSINLTESNKQAILEMDDSQYGLSYSGVINLLLFGGNYRVPIRRTHKQVRFRDLVKMKKKVEIMDIGDTFKVICIPGEIGGVGSCVDILEHSSPSDSPQKISDTLFG